MLYIIILAGVAALDLIIKHRIEKNYTKDKEKYIFGKAVKIHKYQNKGCFLGFMNRKTGVVRAVSLFLTLVCAVLFGVLLSKKGMSIKKQRLHLCWEELCPMNMTELKKAVSLITSVSICLF